MEHAAQRQVVFSFELTDMFQDLAQQLHSEGSFLFFLDLEIKLLSLNSLFMHSNFLSLADCFNVYNG